MLQARSPKRPRGIVFPRADASGLMIDPGRHPRTQKSRLRLLIVLFVLVVIIIVVIVVIKIVVVEVLIVEVFVVKLLVVEVIVEVIVEIVVEVIVFIVVIIVIVVFEFFVLVGGDKIGRQRRGPATAKVRLPWQAPSAPAGSDRTWGIPRLWVVGRWIRRPHCYRHPPAGTLNLKQTLAAVAGMSSRPEGNAKSFTAGASACRPGSQLETAGGRSKVDAS